MALSFASGEEMPGGSGERDWTHSAPLCKVFNAVMIREIEIENELPTIVLVTLHKLNWCFMIG